jgi:hypothetical protein
LVQREPVGAAHDALFLPFGVGAESQLLP